jgi:hypothetical protein
MEMIESDMPLTFLGYGLLPDSGGAGRHRGGLGLWREWRVDCAAAQLSTNLDRFKFPPFGLDGGLPASLSTLTLIRGGKWQALPSKVTNLMLRRGDIVRLETSGGGGFGEPRTRARELIERDIRHGYVTPKAAGAVYGHPGAGVSWVDPGAGRGRPNNGVGSAAGFASVDPTYSTPSGYRFIDIAGNRLQSARNQHLRETPRSCPLRRRLRR